MKSVLVTGGLGNIGVKIIDELLRQGYGVKCLDLKTKPNLKVAKRYKNKVNLIWGDITRTDQVNDAVQGVDAVIHTAAILPPFSEQKSEFSHRVNVGGTKNIIAALEAGKTANDSDKQLIFASSVSVHGNHLPNHPPGRSIDDPYHPVDHYAEHKIECEGLLEQSSLNWTVLRVSACVDEKDRVFSVKNVKGSIETFLSVDPMCRIEYVHPADVATAMVNAIGNKEASRKRFFVGGGERCQSTWRELNCLRLEMLGLPNPPADCFGTEGFYTEWLDTGESQRVLKFQKHDLDAYKAEMKDLFKWPRRLLLPLRPILKRYLWQVVPNRVVIQKGQQQASSSQL